jgi:hypothetical protein
VNQACYRKLKKYKYELVQPCEHDTGIEGYSIDTRFLRLQTNGRLLIFNKYAWDGPSGPTLDTLDFMRGSLVHDALYQLIRSEKLPYSTKGRADALMREICLQDGMSRFRAWYVYQAVKLFGGSSARPGPERTEKIICTPEQSEPEIPPEGAGE